MRMVNIRGEDPKGGRGGVDDLLKGAEFDLERGPRDVRKLRSRRPRDQPRTDRGLGDEEALVVNADLDVEGAPERLSVLAQRFDLRAFDVAALERGDAVL